ncbi:hypothetical protein RNZ50_00035 [Paracoccaceae bacterium Fryx2]|nr:hypothetical protein [Paracoccaceae bacterium Fryx2]
MLVDALQQAAPVLDPWFVVRDPASALCLSGAVSNHPLLSGEGRWVATSMLFGLDPQAGHARTYSRWYRLGRLIDVAEYEALRGKPLNPALKPVRADDVKPWLARMRKRVAREGLRG